MTITCRLNGKSTENARIRGIIEAAPGCTGEGTYDILRTKSGGYRVFKVVGDRAMDASLKDIPGGVEMTKRELLDEAVEDGNGDFWLAVENLIKAGWTLGDFEDAEISSVFVEGFDNPVEENLESLKGLLRVQAANIAGATWMETVLTECDEPDEWLGLNYQELLQAAANANHPAFPSFESGEELDAAYQGAWDQLGSSRRLHAEDKVYQEDLEKRKEGWKDYDGK